MSEEIKQHTFYLSARPSFFSGMGCIFDFQNSLNTYNTSKTAEEADYIALLNDWIMTGNDIRSSIKKYKQERTRVTKEQ